MPPMMPPGPMGPPPGPQGPPPGPQLPPALAGLQGAAPPPAPVKTSQDSVVYMTGDKGPFMCSHCEYFTAPNACQIVDGKIDPMGCCNLYETIGNAQGQGGPMAGPPPSGPMGPGGPPPAGKPLAAGPGGVPKKPHLLPVLPGPPPMPGPAGPPKAGPPKPTAKPPKKGA
jgi:hypothetical protein